MNRIQHTRPGSCPFQYEGIVTTSNTPCLLFPGLFKNYRGMVGKKFHVYVKIEQKILPPADILHKPLSEWPESYKSRYFMSPMILTFEYYAHKDGVLFPNVREDLDDHFLLGTSFIELYRGGAGFKAVEFEYVQHMPEVTENVWREKLSMIRYISNSLASCDDYFQYLSPKDVFLEGLKNGYSGPFVSYWARLNDSDKLNF